MLPRPLGAFCLVNCRSGGGSSAGRHAGALQGEAGVPGPKADGGSCGGAGAGRAGLAGFLRRTPRPRRACQPPILPATVLEDAHFLRSALSAHTHFRVTVSDGVEIGLFGEAQRSGDGGRALYDGN